MIKTSIITFFLVFHFSISAAANPKILNLDDVLESLDLSHPEILSQQETIKAGESAVISSQGAFDLRIKSENDSILSGYYNGSSSKWTLNKPTGFLNADVYTGYKVSRGQYPDYEGKRDTLNDGELLAGFKFSLLQFRDMDEKRLKLGNSQVKLLKTKNMAESKRLYLMESAAKAYWKWVTSGKILIIYNNLLSNALEREKALEKQVASGAKAEITLVENQRSIVKRKTQVIESKRNFEEASLRLSLFYRDKESFGIKPSIEQIPESIQTFNDIDPAKYQSTLIETLSRQPQLLAMDQKIKELKNNLSFFQSARLPKMDINYEVSKDFGEGLEKLEGTSNRVMLKFEWPFSNNNYNGKKLQTQSEIRSLGWKKRYFLENLKNEINTIYININAASKKIKNTRQEVKLAERLQEAEIKRFNNGASDFFILNLREQMTADAKVRNIKAYMEYHSSKAAYNALSMLY